MVPEWKEKRRRERIFGQFRAPRGIWIIIVFFILLLKWQKYFFQVFWGASQALSLTSSCPVSSVFRHFQISLQLRCPTNMHFRLFKTKCILEYLTLLIFHFTDTSSLIWQSRLTSFENPTRCTLASWCSTQHVLAAERCWKNSTGGKPGAAQGPRSPPSPAWSQRTTGAAGVGGW